MLTSSLASIPDVTHAPLGEHGSAGSLGARFTSVCQERGDAPAVTSGTQSIGYAELGAQATHLAAALQAMHLPANAIVAILADRSIDMVAAMLAVTLAGAAYLPLDPGFPEARLRDTLADAAPFAVLTDRTQAHKLAGDSGRVLLIENLLSAPPVPFTEPLVAEDDLAYVIYTSGSTGKPKGVMVSHRNVLRLLDTTAPWFGFGPADVWTMFHSFAFDFSVWELWGSLLTGGRVVLVPFSTSRSPEDFRALLVRERVTVLNQTPTAFSLLMQADAQANTALRLRYIIFGGEALNLLALLPWFRRHGDTAPQLINMYGITETTVHVTYRPITAADAANETDSLIGEPIPDLQLHLLDEHLLPVPEGEPGEICIGGPGVARGYLGRPALTAERFLADPFSAGRLYRSGDLARRRADGELVYLGRADRQVKISGFRIELGEVEAVLLGCAGVAQTCVTTCTDVAGAQRLAAYIVATGSFALATLKAFAEAHLPAHMRPSFYTPLPALPINGNGKIDLAALPAAALAPSLTSSPMPSPTPPNFSATEQRVAAVWQQVLGTAAIAVSKTDNFFDAGGSSVLLIALRTGLQETFGITIPVTWMFEHTTIEALAARLDAESRGASAMPTPAATQAPAAGLTRAEQQRGSFARMKALRGGAR